MAATQTVAQPFPLRKFVCKTSELKPKHGVIVLSGFGINVRVERGHLFLEDGIGEDRMQCRISRVDRGLKRLVVIGSDGMASLAALRWLADRDASFVMLDRDGSVLVTTGPVRPSDVRMRRAQALALQNGTALKISRELIDRKLAGQEGWPKKNFSMKQRPWQLDDDDPSLPKSGRSTRLDSSRRKQQRSIGLRGVP
jgi:CRISPR/Cas system-associated endonuclease Cas1